MRIMIAAFAPLILLTACATPFHVETQTVVLSKESSLVLNFGQALNPTGDDYTIGTLTPCAGIPSATVPGAMAKPALPEGKCGDTLFSQKVSPGIVKLASPAALAAAGEVGGNAVLRPDKFNSVSTINASPSVAGGSVTATAAGGTGGDASAKGGSSNSDSQAYSKSKSESDAQAYSKSKSDATSIGAPKGHGGHGC